MFKLFDCQWILSVRYSEKLAVPKPFLQDISATNL